MKPTWTVYKDASGDLKACWEYEDDLPVNRSRVVGYATCHRGEDAIQYIEELLR